MPSFVHLSPSPAPLPHPHRHNPSLPHWNALLADLSRAGRHAHALALLPPLLAASQGLCPDAFTLPPAAKSCAALRDPAAGLQLHSLAAKLALDHDPFVANSLLSMYGTCGRVADAQKLFDGMPAGTRNLVSWNAFMAALSDAGLPRRALELFQDCLGAGMAPDEATLVTALPACAALGCVDTGRALHGLAVKSGWDGHTRVSNALIDMYAKCREVADAERAFFSGASKSERSIVSWNIMLRGHARNGDADAAFGLLQEMQMEHGVPADEITILSVLPVCSRLSELKELHSFVIRRGLHLTGYMVPNALIAAYGKCGCLLHADRVFAGMRSRTSVMVSSWNALIGAHVQNGEAGTAIGLFLEMNTACGCGFKPDCFSIGGLLLACAHLRHLLYSKATHGFILRNGLERDSFIRASLLSAYIQCGMESCARLLFDAMSMDEKADEEVSWNTMISGYSRNGQPDESLQFFREMMMMRQSLSSGSGGHWPSLISATAALASCSQLAAVRLGKEVHCFALKADYCQDPFLSSAMIDMYAKCGFVDEARMLFDRLKTEDSVSWTSMITGYAINGLGKEAVELYDEMRRKGMEPDELTYLGLLMACNHAGMLQEGMDYLKEMRSHRIEPKLEHYGCVIGMLSRAGRLADAVAVMEEMPEEADAKILSSVLSACHIHGHGETELGKEVAGRLLELQPERAEHYVLASNMYAGTGQWDEMRKVRRRMRDAGVAKDKEPGCSWVEVAGKVHSFVAGESEANSTST